MSNVSKQLLHIRNKDKKVRETSVCHLVQPLGYCEQLTMPGTTWNSFADLFRSVSRFPVSPSIFFLWWMKQFLFNYFFFPCLLYSVYQYRAMTRGKLFLVRNRISLLWWGQKQFSWRGNRIIFSTVRKSTWTRSWFNIMSGFLCQLWKVFCLVLKNYFISSQNARASGTVKHLKKVHKT